MATRETADAARQPAQMRGVHAGAIVLVGVLALNVGNYAFHLIAARELGPERYGDVATLVAISGLVALPLGAVQMWVARYVAHYEAVGDAAAAHWFARRSLAYAAFGGLAASALLLTVAWPIQQVLGIASIAAVVLTALTPFPAATSQITWGLAQGLQRFKLIAATYIAGAVTRVGLTVLAFAVGLQVGGAMLATLAAMLVALALPLWMLREWLRPASPTARRVTRGDAARSLVPIAVGLLALTALTSVDVVVAKLALDERAAGIYGSASLIGRVILYLPAAIITVLLPRVTARAAGRTATIDILRRSAAVTIAFCVSLTVAYGVVGEPLVRVAFGADYAEAAPLLWLFGTAMTGYALLNVLLVYHLGHDRRSFAFLLGAAAVVQLVLFALFHGSAHELLAVDIAVAAVLLLLHEAMTRGLLVRALAGRTQASV